jgi:hypothetical protein
MPVCGGVRQRARLTEEGGWCITYTRKRWSLSDLLLQLWHSYTFKGAEA